jgi:hypothetical protein
MSTPTKWLSTGALILAAAGCTETAPTPDKTAATTTATAAATAAVAPPRMASPGAVKLSVDTASSKVDFMMEAPQEKIAGHVPGATTGDLQIDVMDLTKSTGAIAVDISGIEIVQTKADKDGKFGAETKSEPQNKHARTWLEISPDTPDKERKENSRVTLTIKSIEVTGEKNLLKIPGAERKVSLKVTGDFTLHGKTVPKVAELDATFKMDGDKPVSVAIKSTKPFAVGLAEHDVKPRDAFGKLASKTLDLLSPKVNKEAQVTLDLTAKAH